MKEQGQNSIESAFERLIGRQPTDADKKRLYEIKDALKLSNNDALWLVLIALQSYDEMYREIPREIQAAAAAAARSSASQAKDQITAAVASLVPSVRDAVKKAAEDAIITIQAGKSALSIWAGALAIAVAMAIGWGFGTGTLQAVQAKLLTWRQVFEVAGFGVGVGVIGAAAGLVGLLGTREGREAPVWAIIGMSAAAVCYVSLLMMWYFTIKG